MNLDTVPGTKDCVQIPMRLFIEFVLHADRLCHVKPNQRWPCVSYIWTG